MGRGLFAKDFRRVRVPRNSGTLWRCHTNAIENADCGIHTRSKSSDQRLPCAGFLVSLMRASSPYDGAQKNTLRRVRNAARRLVRPQDTKGSRSVVWRHADLFGVGHPACRLSVLRQGEARGAGVPGRQPVLHQAFCLVRWPALCDRLDQIGRRGAAA